MNPSHPPDFSPKCGQRAHLPRNRPGGGMAGNSVTPESLATPNRALQLYMVHFVEEVPERNRLGIGTGINPNRQDHSFPFIKCLVLGEDNENQITTVNKNGGTWSPHYTIPSLLSCLRAPSSQHSMRRRRASHIMGPRGARGLGRSGWCPIGPRATTSQG